LSALDRFRTDHDLTVDEAIIFIAIGDLNLASRQTDVLTMRPTNMTMIAYQLDIPRETVRRKVKTLLNKGLVRARGRELYLDDLKLWIAIGDQLSGSAQLLKAVA
jgi:predicted DNA-binding transcriptional regulator